MNAPTTFVFREKLAAAYRLEERLEAVEAEILRIIGEPSELAARMARFECIHGVGRVAAFSLVLRGLRLRSLPQRLGLRVLHGARAL